MSAPSGPSQGRQPHDPYPWVTQPDAAQSVQASPIPKPAPTQPRGSFKERLLQKPALSYLGALLLTFVTAFFTAYNVSTFTGLGGFKYSVTWWGSVKWEANGLGAQAMIDEFSSVADGLSSFYSTCTTATLVLLAAAAILAALRRQKLAAISGLCAGVFQLAAVIITLLDANDADVSVGFSLWLWLLLSAATLYFSFLLLRVARQKKKQGTVA